ncbi:Motile sperm domain-containing protein 2 [Dermatophagoides pteronyssinus]|uniref:Motile sperm domain-containing protein 2 n=1 Tax=Dermatophagoides pteronyssinus TaxID=6956 RepID=A0ABQ8IZK3_DERPT|nr:Motile sperm domain-containing protein 2 [Dermatophagoides pteronyssinus]
MASFSSENMEHKIQQVRSIIMQKYESNNELYHEKDIEYLQNDNWTVERYIQRGKTVDKSFQLLDNVLKFRREIDMPVLESVCFPRELFKIGYAFNGGHDRQGNGVVFMRPRFYRKIKKLDRKIKQFVCYQMEIMDKKTKGRGMAIIVDLKSIGLMNLDIEYILWGITNLIDCCPTGLNYIMLYDFSWLVTSIWNQMKKLLPADLEKNIIDPHHVPDECLTLIDYGRQNDWLEKEIDHVLKLWKPFLDKADEEIKKFVQ